MVASDEYSRNHYDRVASSGVGRGKREALRRRAEGAAYPLKRFHNDVKRFLIDSFAYNAPRLLDVACGRGGDLQKWIRARVRRVDGIDISPGEILEARRRDEALMRMDGRVTRCSFEVRDDFGTSPVTIGEEAYDVVTCMFALQYFWKSEATLRTFLQNVSRNLKPGGYFVGVVPDGRGVRAAMSKLAGAGGRLGALRLEAFWSDDEDFQKSSFGREYACSIDDTVTSAEDHGTDGSREFLVDGDALVSIAADCGLAPVLGSSVWAKSGGLVENRPGAAFKHFSPSYASDADPGLEVASKMNAAFAFYKKRERVNM